MEQNKVRIRAIAKGLEDLGEDIYFVGGAVVSLYADYEEVFDHRITDDVDVVVEILSRGAYFKLQEKLRSIGFKEDVSSHVICRWIYQGIIVDVMPLAEDVLGFSNQWYQPAIREAIQVEIGPNVIVNIFSYPYFLATKLEALQDRGVDCIYSKDFEDIIKTLEARGTAIDEIEKSEQKVKDYIITQINGLVKDEAMIKEAIAGVLYENRNQSRFDDIFELLKTITQL